MKLQTADDTAMAKDELANELATIEQASAPQLCRAKKPAQGELERTAPYHQALSSETTRRSMTTTGIGTPHDHAVA